MEELKSSEEVVSTTAISVAEFYLGAYRARDKMAALTEADKFLEPFSTLELDFPSAKLYGQIGEKLKSNMLAPLDLLIAAIALANKQTLLTRNVKHFERVPGLIVESW